MYDLLHAIETDSEFTISKINVCPFTSKKPHNINMFTIDRSTSLWKASCSKAIERQTVVGGKYIMMPLKLKANTKGKEHKRQDKIEAEVRKRYKFKNEETRKLARIKHIKH